MCANSHGPCNTVANSECATYPVSRTDLALFSKEHRAWKIRHGSSGHEPMLLFGWADKGGHAVKQNICH